MQVASFWQQPPCLTPMHLFESLGLGLLLIAVAIGLLSLWFHSDAGHAMALRIPGLSGLLRSRALTLLLMGAGVGLLLRSVLVPPVPPPEAMPPDTHSTPPVAPPASAPPATAALPDLPVATSAPSMPQPTISAPVSGASVPALVTAPLAAANALPTATPEATARLPAPRAADGRQSQPEPAENIRESRTLPAIRPHRLAPMRPVGPGRIVSPGVMPTPQAAPDMPERPAKRNIFSARCARLLEKVGAGEPMTPQEQHEMVSKCQ